MQLERTTYSGPELGLPELELFGWLSTSSATQSRLTRHRHENAFEICLITRGRVQWWVGHESYELRRGSVYVTRPDEPHGAEDGVMNPSELYWLILPQPSSGNLPGLTAAQTRGLFGGLATLEHRTFPASPELQHCFRRLHREAQRKDDLTEIAARSLLHRLLAQILRDHASVLAAPRSGDQSHGIREAMRWITDNLGEQINVGSMAKAAGMSIGRFHERFLAEVGQTPTEYLNWARVLRGKAMLTDTSKSVSDITFELGFSSSQYFATVFKKYVGTSPAQYRTSRTQAPRGDSSESRGATIARDHRSGRASGTREQMDSRPTPVG